MIAYYLLILVWTLLYIIIRPKQKKKQSNIIFAIMSGASLSLLMGLRHYSVGNDIARYLIRYNGFMPDLNMGLFQYDEWGFHLFNIFSNYIGLSNQGYLMFTSLIIVASFVLFYYSYSKNIYLSLFLHLTIGLFTMSMSGIRQTLSVIVLMLAFYYIQRKKLIFFVITVLIATTIHNTAIIFLPIYFIRNVKVTQKIGSLLLGVTFSFIIFRKLLVPLVNLLAPDRYLDKYELLTDAFQVNPLIIVIATAIPAASLLLWKNIENMSCEEHRFFSNLFILACLNLFFNILSLNSNMLGRLSFYFIPYITLLIPNIISVIKDKKVRIIALYLAIILPLIQFTLSTPGGSLRIDHYKFFWQ